MQDVVQQMPIGSIFGKDDATAAAEESAEPSQQEEEPCPICLSVIHTTSRQLPRVLCGTCRNAFHACCLYRWLSSRQGAGRCPICQTAI